MRVPWPKQQLLVAVTLKDPGFPQVSQKFIKGCLGVPQGLEIVKDFLIKLGIKLCMNLWKISILSINNVIVRLTTKIMNRADKSWAHF